MQCPSCHAENAPASRFCQNCGAEITPTAANPPYTTAPPGAGYAAPPAAPYGQAPVLQGGLADNVAGAIAYLTFIPAVIFLLVEPYRGRPFVRFHAYQCIALSIVSFVGHLVLIFMPFHLFMLSSLWSLLMFVAWLIAIVSAAQGKWFKLPGIGPIAEQQSRKSTIL